MRVAAVALVLIVGAAVVLAFANTLSSWVLGGLLGGLASILLSIPISLALFTLLARRHDVRQRSVGHTFANEPNFVDGTYSEPMMYEAEGYLLPVDEEFSSDLRALPESRRLPVSGYLPLPPAEQDLDMYGDDPRSSERREPRNYPRQPRYAARLLARNDEAMSPLPPAAGSRRNQSTSSLAQHQSAALRQARQEARQRVGNRPGSGTPARRDQEGRPASPHRSRFSRQLRPQAPGSRRPGDDYDIRHSRQSRTWASWREDEDFSEELSTEQLRARSQRYPRPQEHQFNPRSAHAADPWTGQFDDDDRSELMARRPRRDPERTSGTLRNPLVRRAPYLYEDDPLREEFAQQLDSERPITRRSSLYERYDGKEEEY